MLGNIAGQHTIILCSTIVQEFAKGIAVRESQYQRHTHEGRIGYPVVSAGLNHTKISALSSYIVLVYIRIVFAHSTCTYIILQSRYCPTWYL